MPWDIESGRFPVDEISFVQVRNGLMKANPGINVGFSSGASIFTINPPPSGAFLYDVTGRISTILPSPTPMKTLSISYFVGGYYCNPNSLRETISKIGKYYLSADFYREHISSISGNIMEEDENRLLPFDKTRATPTAFMIELYGGGGAGGLGGGSSGCYATTGKLDYNRSVIIKVDSIGLGGKQEEGGTTQVTLVHETTQVFTAPGGNVGTYGPATSTGTGSVEATGITGGVSNMGSGGQAGSGGDGAFNWNAPQPGIDGRVFVTWYFNGN